MLSTTLSLDKQRWGFVYFKVAGWFLGVVETLVLVIGLSVAVCLVFRLGCRS